MQNSEHAAAPSGVASARKTLNALNSTTDNWSNEVSCLMRAKENPFSQLSRFLPLTFHCRCPNLVSQFKWRAIATLISSSTENGEIVKVMMEIKIHQHHDWLFILSPLAHENEMKAIKDDVPSH